MPVTIDFTHLDEVLNKTVSTIEDSKGQIFDIAEHAREESMLASEELEQIKRDVFEIVHKNDELDKKFRESRQKLVHVSQNFNIYNEIDIRKAYEQASQIQAELTITREKETFLRGRRDLLERRLKNLADTIEKADTIMVQMGVVLTYLTGEIENIHIAAESAEQRKMFPIKIIQAQEEERKRVARDIHDGPAQSMANVVIRSEIAERILNQGRVEEAKEELRALKEMVRNTLGEVRKIIFDLRPMALDDLGIVPTLRKFVDDFNQRYQLDTELRTFGEEQRLPSSIEVVTFRMIQEAMNNAAKHAQAKKVEIKLEFGEGYIVGVVKDDGIGFEQKKKTGQPSFGIMGMKERMRLLEGKLEIESTVGNGTKVVFSIPVKPIS